MLHTPQPPQYSAVDQCGGKIALILAGRDSAQPGTQKAAAWCLLGGCHPTVLISLRLGVKWLRPPMVQINHGQAQPQKEIGNTSTMLDLTQQQSYKQIPTNFMLST